LIGAHHHAAFWSLAELQRPRRFDYDLRGLPANPEQYRIRPVWRDEHTLRFGVDAVEDLSAEAARQDVDGPRVNRARRSTALT
jgi:hypothetical protein